MRRARISGGVQKRRKRKDQTEELGKIKKKRIREEREGELGR